MIIFDTSYFQNETVLTSVLLNIFIPGTCDLPTSVSQLLCEFGLHMEVLSQTKFKIPKELYALCFKNICLFPDFYCSVILLNLFDMENLMNRNNLYPWLFFVE